jgi:hypothetical protein
MYKTDAITNNELLEKRSKFLKDLESIKDFTIDDGLIMTGGSWGRFQVLSSLSFFILFGVGS